MKALSGIVTVLLTGGSLFGTVVEIRTIEQPINLGAKADPSRIPLGPVVVETNHGYDRHQIISAPRPCAHGALHWEKGQELNMNLASAFGIEVVPEDGSNVPQQPVTIKVRDWPVPAYSPYRKDQVLSATLHCLLRSVYATPKMPLKILIEAENPQDAINLKGFAGTYLTAEANEHGGPTPVPGTSLATDWRGITSVVLTEAKPPPADALRRPPPVLVPFRFADDTDSDEFSFIPVWTGDAWKGDRRKLIAEPAYLFHDLFDSSWSAGPDINALTKLGLATQCTLIDNADGTRFELTLYQKTPDQDPGDLAQTLAAFCHAVILTTQPSQFSPLTVEIKLRPDLLQKHLGAFVADRHWQVREADGGGTRVLSCKFSWDSDQRKLTAGSIPLGRVAFQIDRPWSLSFAPENAAAN